jgi:flavin-dependent dehydrogenase
MVAALELNGEIRLGSLMLPGRDLITTTPQGAPFLSFYHPRMQETVLAWAAEMGAEVRRGVSVAAVEGGKNATAITTTDVGHRERLQARLIVASWPGVYQVLQVEHLPPPLPTLLRYHWIYRLRNELLIYDYVYYLDVDMEI